MSDHLLHAGVHSKTLNDVICLHKVAIQLYNYCHVFVLFFSRMGLPEVYRLDLAQELLATTGSSHGSENATRPQNHSLTAPNTAKGLKKTRMLHNGTEKTLS